MSLSNREGSVSSRSARRQTGVPFHRGDTGEAAVGAAGICHWVDSGVRAGRSRNGSLRPAAMQSPGAPAGSRVLPGRIRARPVSAQRPVGQPRSIGIQGGLRRWPGSRFGGLRWVEDWPGTCPEHQPRDLVDGDGRGRPRRRREVAALGVAPAPGRAGARDLQLAGAAHHGIGLRHRRGRDPSSGWEPDPRPD